VRTVQCMYIYILYILYLLCSVSTLHAVAIVSQPAPANRRRSMSMRDILYSQSFRNARQPDEKFWYKHYVESTVERIYFSTNGAFVR
jgi:hypothetical protein